MNRHEEIKDKIKDVKITSWDKITTLNNPQKLLERFKAKVSLAIAGGYNGASKSRRQTKNYRPTDDDADTVIKYDLDQARARSHDLIRNNPIAGGAINTKTTSVIGSGLRLNANINNNILGLTIEESKKVNSQIESEWNIFCKEADIRKSFNLNYLQSVIYRGEKESGDILINMPFLDIAGHTYSTKIQLIEGDRLSNPDNKQNDEKLTNGVEKDQYGAPIWYHIDISASGTPQFKREWKKLKAFGSKTGRRNIIHYYKQKRPNQTRGMPDLTSVIELIKQLGDYTDAEVQAAVISGMFAIFVKSEYDGSFGESSNGNDEIPPLDVDMTGGVATRLLPNESIESVQPGRPNQNFDPFFLAIVRQIGMGLELPYELLIKHFSASFSASKAALLEAWRYFTAEREFFTEQVLKPIYEAFFYEAVALGRIKAPSFISGDPAIREAWLRSTWKGSAKGNLKELEAVRAAQERVDAGFSSIQGEIDEMGTGDWDSIHQQRTIEHAARKEAGLLEIAEQIVTVERENTDENE